MARFIQLTVLVVLQLGFFGCASEITPKEEPLEKPALPISYLALGDSYTIGESVAEAERWPVQLATQLNAEGLSVPSPQIIARTGWTTNELQEAIRNASLEDTFDLVSLLIGVNNQYRGYPFEQYETEFVALLDRAIQYAQGDTAQVFVVSIPDYAATPFGQGREPRKIAMELDRYNAYAQQICENYGIPFFDITPISRTAPSDPELVAPDNLHPSGKMYAQWISLFWEDVKKLVD